MKKLFYCLCLLAVVFAGCKKERQHPLPAITVTVGGTQIEEGASISIDIDRLPVAINAAVENVETGPYLWRLNGEPIADATGSEYSFESEWSGAYPLSVTATSSNNQSATFHFVIDVDGPYKEGVIFYSTSYAGLGFQAPGAEYDQTVYEKVNGSQNGILSQDIDIVDNRLYVLAQNKIVACDAQTFRRIEEYGEFSGIGSVYRFVKAGDTRFYLSSDRVGNTGGGIWIFEKQGDDYVLSSAAIEGTESAPFSKPIRVGGHIVAGNGSDIAVIDPATDKTVTHPKNGIEPNPQRQITDVLRGRDGFLYAVAYSHGKAYPPSAPSVTSSVIKIDPSDFSFVEEVELDAGDGAIYQVQWGGNQAHATASLSTDEIFVMATRGVYKYNFATKTTTLFAPMTFGYAGSAQSYMAMGVDREHLYVPLTNYATSTISRYNIATGEKDQTSWSVTGDASVISTYQFSQSDGGDRHK